MTDARQTVLAHLSRAARARRRRRAGRHAASALSLACGLLVTSVVALSVAPALREWMLVALASVTLVGAGMSLGALLRRERPAATAAWIARRRPDFGGALADAAEFADVLAAGRPIATGSSDLARAHVRRAAEMAAAENPASHARASLAPPPWRTAAGLAVAALAALALVPSGRRVLLFGPPPPAPERVTYGAVELTYRYPAYLGLAERTETGTGDVEAPAGTHVTLRVRADRPLATGRIEPHEGVPVEMQVDGDTAAGTLVVTRTGTYRLALRGARGEVDPDPPRHVVSVLPDAAPVVRLRAPREDVALDEGARLGVAWSAEDDHGVAEVVAVVRRGNSDGPPAAGSADDPDAIRLPLESFEPASPGEEGDATFSTEELGLLPGEFAWLWIEARDEDQVTGPKWAASSRVRIAVRSATEESAAVDERQQELAERLLALLAAHLVSGPDRLTDARAIADAHASFAAGLASVVVLAGDVVAAAAEEMDDPASATALEDMRGRLDGLARARARRADSLVSGSAPAARQALAALHPGEIEELERDVLFFDMWADRRTSLRASDAADELLAAAEALRELAEKEAPSATAEELLAEADALAAAAAALQPMLEQLASSAGADPASAAEAKEALAALEEASAQLRQRLQSGDRSTARRDASRLEHAASALAGLVGDLADAGAQGDPELARDIERAEADLRRLRREQADLRDQTNRLRDEMRQALSPEDLRQAEEAFRELQQLAEQAVAAHARGEERLGEAEGVTDFFRQIEKREELEARVRDLVASGATLRDDGARELEKAERELGEMTMREMLASGRIESLMRAAQGAREMLGRLSQVLADRDLASARRPARWSLGLLQGLREDVEQDEEDAVRSSEPEFRTAAAKAAEILDKLDELEQQLERSAQKAMTSAQRQRMGQLGQRQTQAQAKARQLAARLRELGADAPFLGEDVAENVDQAGGHMDEATQGLFGQRPGQASEHQGEAMAKLDEATKSLSPSGDRGDGDGQRRASREGAGSQEGRRQGRGGQDGPESRFGRMSRQRVEIPDADAYKVPREFREEILEAMRESSAPDGYAEQVREYYRRLVE